MELSTRVKGGRRRSSERYGILTVERLYPRPVHYFVSLYKQRLARFVYIYTKRARRERSASATLEHSSWTRSLFNPRDLLRVGIRKDRRYNVLILHGQNCTRSLELHLPGFAARSLQLSRSAARAVQYPGLPGGPFVGAHRARHPLTKIRAGVQLSLHYGTSCRQEKKAFVGVLSSLRAPLA